MEPLALSRTRMAQAGYQRQLNGTYGTFFLAFPPGWSRRRNGLWGLNAHARGNIAHGHKPTYRHRPGMVRIPDTDGNGATLVRGFQTPGVLPCLVECPRCRLIQRVDRRTLNVVLWPADPDLPIRPFTGYQNPDSDTATPRLCLDILSEPRLAWVLLAAGYLPEDRDHVETFRQALILVAVGLAVEDRSHARFWLHHARRAVGVSETACRRTLREINDMVWNRNALGDDRPASTLAGRYVRAQSGGTATSAVLS
jgi:hypothetical protein